MHKVERVFTIKVTYTVFDVGDIVYLAHSDTDDMTDEEMARPRVVREFEHPVTIDDEAIVYFEGEPNSTAESSMNCVLIQEAKVIA